MRFLGILASGFLAAAAAAADAGRSPGLGDLVHTYADLKVAAESAPAQNLKLTAGHLTCTLVSGSVAYVKAGDEAIGLFFQGNGTMAYVSDDPIEAPVLTYVAKKSTSLSPEKGDKSLRVQESITRLLWVVSPDKLPELSGLAPTPLTAAFAAHREKFSHKRGAELSIELAFHRLAEPTSPFGWVEIEGGPQDLLYERGGAENGFERLLFVHGIDSSESKLKDMLVATTLSDQPVGRDPHDPPKPRFLLTDVDLEVRGTTGDSVTLSVVETIVPQREPLSVFRFDLDNGVFATFGAHLGAQKDERLEKITDGEGRPVHWHRGDGELLVQTREPMPPDRPFQLRFELAGDILVHPGGSNFWELGVWDWFPQPELCEQYYTLHAVVRVKKPYVPFAPGKTIRRVEEGDENVLETKLDVPVQFAVILAGDYSFREEVRNGVTIRVATYALKNERAVKQLTELAAAIIAFYEEFLGPFPFPEFDIVEIDDYGFGQSPPGVMYITKEAFNPLGGTVENQLYSGGVNERFAHEIAHQYWGHVVKMPSHEEQWLTESFAEYSAALFMRAAKGDATYRSIVSHWGPGAKFATDKAPIPLANRVHLLKDTTTQFAIRTGLLYQKGPLLLYALHKELGEQTFLTFLKSYQKSFRWKFGSTKTVAGLLQFMTKKDYGPFFDQNFWGTGMPKD
jgi:hypothetical protein